MPERVKWSALGSGGIARRRTIPEGITAARNARLAAVFDVDAEVDRAVAAQFGATAAEIEAFGQAVLEGREPSVGAEASVRNQKVLTACYESPGRDTRSASDRLSTRHIGE